MHLSLPSTEDKIVSLADFPEAKGFIIAFTCNHCPYVIAYEQRLIELSNRFAPQGVPLVAINPNDAGKYPQDSFDNMKVRAEAKAFPFPYLRDETQEIAHQFQAQRTPEVFLLWKSGDEWVVRYRGAIDDNYQNPSQVQNTWLNDAIEALLAGESPATDFQPPIGCSIKWK